MVKKQIVIFSALFLPHVGGVENYTFHLATELTKMGHEAIVVTLTSDGAEPAAPYPFSVIRFHSHSFLNGRLPIAKKGSSRLLKSINPDYVIVNTRFYPHSIVGAYFAKRNGIRPLIIEHGSAHITLGSPFVDRVINAYEHVMTKMLKPTKAAFYGVSSKSSEWLRHFGIESSGELSNSIDANEYRKMAGKTNYRNKLGLDNRPIVCFTGRIVPEKGIENLLKAAMEIQDASFCIAGDGPLLQDLKATYKSDHIHFLGSLTQPEISSLLQQSDIFCLPSRSEGFSTSLLEAAACKTMPIMTNVGGAKELIPTQEFGLILKDGNPNTIYDAISRAVNDPEYIKRCSENIYERAVSHYGWKNTAKKIIRCCSLATDNHTR